MEWGIIFILLALGCMVLSGFGSLLLYRSPRRADRVGTFGALLGCGIGTIPAVPVLWSGAGTVFQCAWEVPYGAFHIGIDPLSGFFLLPLLFLSATAALYGGAAPSRDPGRACPAASFLFFNLLVASMVMVIIARNGILFLFAWEAMTLASFFLVTSDCFDASVRRAGRTYLVATHLGTAFLLVFFLILGDRAGSLDFDRFAAAGLAGFEGAGILFLFAFIGFGTKAGFIPFHVWLPEAHPAAPSHVSALMSGVMIKTGIYGLLRALTFLGAPEAWWGWLLVVAGLVSGLLGVLFALAQHDLKRLLAYHSVENIGIIGMGIGLGVLGLAWGDPLLSVLGFAGGLLHVLNHALFKGLLFLCAGAVLHAAGTREMDRLGGLIREMPWTATLFLIGAAAICALPPLNGFVSEFIIFVAALHGSGIPGGSLAGGAVVVGLAMIGGLAVACFTKAFGVVFLGEPRSGRTGAGHEAGVSMRVSMTALAASCIAIGLLAPKAVGIVGSSVAGLAGMEIGAVRVHLLHVTGPLEKIVLASGVLLSLVALLAWGRKRLLSGRETGESGTWDCGYAAPSPRMQYTAASFAGPLTKMGEGFLHSRVEIDRPDGYFPAHASMSTHVGDIFGRYLYRPTFLGISRLLSMLSRLQQGRVQFYVLYIAATLLLLLVWNLGF
jgi:hydrogenase-4 component B